MLFGVAPAQAALTHEWLFNETSGTNLTDSVGNADASVVVLPGGGSSQLTGNAIQLDGGDRATADYVKLPSNVFDGLTNVTIEIWASPLSFQNWGRVIDIGAGDSDPNPTTNNLRLSFSVGTDGNQQWMGYRPYTVVASTLTTQTNQLYFYAIVWSANGGAGGQAHIDWYRDGTLVGGQDVGNSTIANLANLPQTAIWLGRSSYTSDSTANASYQAVRIYDEALDAQAILLHTLKGPDGAGPDGVDGLIHRWSFSETNGTSLQDSVGGANGQIVVQGSADYTLAGGQVQLSGGARDSADYVQLPSGLLNGLSDVTIEAWVTPESAQNWSRLFDFGSGTTTASTWFLSLCRGTSLDQQRLEFLPYTFDSGLTTVPGQPYHYVATWSSTGGTGGGGRMEWYRDGVLVGGVDTGGTTVSAVDDTVLWLGRSQYAGDNNAGADFNEFRIYNRVLTPAEINFNRVNGPDNLTIAPPVAEDDSITLNPGAMALIPVLENDRGSALKPDSLAIVTPPTAGTAVAKPNGKILYTHNGSATMADQFAYTVQNSVGLTSSVATVSITISNALRLPNKTITVPTTPPAVSYQVVDAFPGVTFTQPLALRTPPVPAYSNLLFVVERRGYITYIDVTATNPVKRTFLDISSQLAFDNSAVDGELGLLSMAFHPGFATNGIFFAYYTAPGSPYIDRLARFTADPTNLTVNLSTQQILFNMPDREFNHNGGDLHFGPDGYLYCSMGDEGGQYNTHMNAQRLDLNLFSGILRLDVDKRPGSIEPTLNAGIPTDGSGHAFYSIPPDNPFLGVTNLYGTPVDTNKLRGEFYAIGFRHPWRFSFDPATGELWAGDVGQDLYEEVDIVRKGGNYGWPYYEGTHATVALYGTGGHPGLANPPSGYVQDLPLWEYPHTSVAGSDPKFSGLDVTGSLVYHGTRFPQLTNAYLFNDFDAGGNIWVLRRLTNNMVTVERLAGQPGIAAFGPDPHNGDLLMCNYLQNKLQRLVSSDAAGSGFPTKLSDTGVFADLATLTPNPGVVSYEPIMPFWSDYAIKRRWFTIPDPTNRVVFAKDASWTFPTGMMWIKHFDLEMERGNPATKRRIETRILVKTDDGVYGVSYKWNDTEDEAYLVPDEGDFFSLTVTNNGVPVQQQYEIPSRSSCLACHTPVAGYALSFNTRQLNKEFSMNGVMGNQIATLGQSGYLTAPVGNIPTLPAYAAATNNQYSLEYRVRSYLAVNCVQCHQPGGNSPGSWDARPYLTLAQTMLINGTPMSNDGGDPANKLIVPGDPNHSVLLLRLENTNGFSRMPPLATHQLDEGSINLLTQWITTELTNREDFAQWQITHFGSTNDPAAAASADPDGDGANNYYEFLTMTPPRTNTPPWQISIAREAADVDVNFLRLANRSFLVESSPDLTNWSLWDVPGNQYFFGATNEMTTITGPIEPESTNRFFRVHIFEP